MTLLKIENLSYIFMPQTTNPDFLLRDIHFELKPQETTALLQLRGKTASLLLQILAGKVAPDSGKICLNDNNLTSITDPTAQSAIQYIQPMPFSVEEKQLTVNQFLSVPQKASSRFFSAFRKKSSPCQLPSELQMISNNQPDKLLKELPASDCLLLSFLKPLVCKPDLLLVDLLPCMLPEKITTSALYQLRKALETSGTTLLFTTSSPLLAFHLSRRILVFGENTILREIDNTHKKRENLEDLFSLTEELPYETVNSSHPLSKHYF